MRSCFSARICPAVGIVVFVGSPCAFLLAFEELTGALCTVRLWKHTVASCCYPRSRGLSGHCEHGASGAGATTRAEQLHTLSARGFEGACVIEGLGRNVGVAPISTKFIRRLEQRQQQQWRVDACDMPRISQVCARVQCTCDVVSVSIHSSDYGLNRKLIEEKVDKVCCADQNRFRREFLLFPTFPLKSNHMAG